MKFKVGDKVRVRSLISLKAEFSVNTCDNFSFLSVLTPLCGQFATIHAVHDPSVFDSVELPGWYELVSDGGRVRWNWAFDEEMLEPVTE